MSTRWIEPPRAQEPAVTPPREAPERGLARHVQRKAEPVAEPSTHRQPEPLVPSPEGASPVVAEPALRADSVQRAARESALNKGLATRANEQLSQAPVDAQAALRKGMASAGRSDCLKGGEGGYANSGLGLFALPLLVLDAANGRCK